MKGREKIMLLSTQTDVLGKSIGDKQAIRTIAAAGFDAYDISLMAVGNTAGHPFNGPDYLEYTKRLRAAAEEVGIVCNQAHAPFPSSVKDPARTEEIFGGIVRAMEIAACLGARTIVVHPKQHLHYADPGSPERLFEENIAFYNRLLPYCKKFGIRVALENMWQLDADRHVVPSTCALPEEFARYLDALDPDWFVACLDIGHTWLVGVDYHEMIHALGSRLQALHVHDVRRDLDLHVLPLHTKVDYDVVLSELAANGYAGDMTLEADGFVLHLPTALYPEAYHYMHAVGRYLIEQFKEKQARLTASRRGLRPALQRGA